MKVRCISPHGGMHGGDPRKGIPPAVRGYVVNAALSADPIAVGDVLDAPDGFIPDGFHFEATADLLPPSPPLPAASAGSLADLLAKGAQ